MIIENTPVLWNLLARRQGAQKRRLYDELFSAISKDMFGIRYTNDK